MSVVGGSAAIAVCSQICSQTAESLAQFGFRVGSAGDGVVSIAAVLDTASDPRERLSRADQRGDAEAPRAAVEARYGAGQRQVQSASSGVSGSAARVARPPAAVRQPGA
jgi:hypothetical protein